MERKQIIEGIVSTIDETKKKVAVVTSTGLISRELFTLADANRNFYMTGSMGLASSLGLGVSVNKLDTKVVIIEGDASILMNFGSVATIGHFAPSNLIHIVLDNNAYGSCGEEPSISKDIKLEDIAKMLGYKKVKRVYEKDNIHTFLKESLENEDGPIFILIKMDLGGCRDLPRPLELDNIGKRFQMFLSNKMHLSKWKNLKKR